MVDDQLGQRVMLRVAPAPAGGARLPARTRQANADGAKLLRDSLASVMKQHLSPEQWSHYQAEVDKRNARRKQVGVRYLVDALDRELYLSDSQQEKLAESLSTHWDDGWCVCLEYLLVGNQFYPSDLDRLVTPLLSDAQKKVWQGSQKVSGFGRIRRNRRGIHERQ